MKTPGADPYFDVYTTRTQVPWESPVLRHQREHRRKRGPLLHIVLFAVTFVTTATAGAFDAGANPLADPASIRAGFPYAIALLSILLTHELGHYVLAKVHGVFATLPYFIPAPPLLTPGTFGAFIRMQSPPRNRRALFDVGAAGPWAGVLVAIPAVIIGLRLSEVRPLGLHDGGMIFGDSLLFSFLTRLALGVVPDNVTIILHPIATAGWFGLFVTCLNLLPIGQLDGGHVTYALFGTGHRIIARLFVAVIVVLGVLTWPGWLVWVVLAFVIGIDHPPTDDVRTPLDPRRRIAGWLTIGLFVVTFMPNPISTVPPSPIFEGETIPVALQIPGRHHTAPGRYLMPLLRQKTRRSGISL